MLVLQLSTNNLGIPSLFTGNQILIPGWRVHLKWLATRNVLSNGNGFLANLIIIATGHFGGWEVGMINLTWTKSNWWASHCRSFLGKIVSITEEGNKLTGHFVKVTTKISGKFPGKLKVTSLWEFYQHQRARLLKVRCSRTEERTKFCLGCWLSDETYEKILPVTVGSIVLFFLNENISVNDTDIYSKEKVLLLFIYMSSREWSMMNWWLDFIFWNVLIRLVSLHPLYHLSFSLSLSQWEESSLNMLAPLTTFLARELEV